MTYGAEPAAGQTASRRQFVILSSEQPPEPGVMAEIGSRTDILDKLALANTAADGSDMTDVLYGPGIRIELTPNQDPVCQMLVTITEEEIGWQVLRRFINHFRWKLLDPNTGDELTPSS